MRRLLVALTAIGALVGCTEHRVVGPPPITNPAPAILVQTSGDTFVTGAGFAVRATAIVRDTNGLFNVPASDSVVWSTSDTTLATILPIGVANIKATPSSNIYTVDLIGTFHGIVGRHTITIIPDIKSVKLSLASSLRAVGVGESLTVTVRDPRGPITTVPIVWSATGAAATVSQSGVVSVLRPGTATIYVDALGHRDSLRLHVVAPYTVTPITGWPALPSLALTQPGFQLTENGDVLGMGTVYHAGVVRPLDNCVPFNINNRGQVLCLSTLNGTQVAAVWDGGVVTAIKGLDVATPSAFSGWMNDSGAVAYVDRKVVADSACAANAPCATIWRRNRITPLKPPGVPASVVHFDDAEDVTLNLVNAAAHLNAATGGWDAISLDFGSSVRATVQYASDLGIMSGTTTFRSSVNWFWRPIGGQSILTLGSLTVTGLNDAPQFVGGWPERSTGYLYEILDGYIGRLQDLTVDGSWTPDKALAINNHGAVLATAVNRTDGHTGLVILSPTP